MEKEYLVDYDKYIKRAFDTLENSDKVSEQNKKDIKNFVEVYSAEKDLAKPSTLKHLKQITMLAEFLGKDFRSVKNDKDAILKLIHQLKGMNIADRQHIFGEEPKKKNKQRHYSDATIYEFKKELKVFYKWLNGGEDYPLCVKRVKLGKKPVKRITAEQLITYKEYWKLVNNAKTFLDRAMISFHLESGCRVGEFIPLKIGNCIKDPLGIRVETIGKTGHRTFRLIESVPFLNQWLEEHPNGDDKDAYLWITKPIEKPEDLNNFKVRYLRRLRKLCKELGINKYIWFHLGRHSRVTILLKDRVPGKIIHKQFGWAPDSQMLSRYTHLADKDVDNALAERLGINNGAKENEKRVQCRICKYFNNPTNTELCSNCGAPFNIQAVHETQAKIKYEKIGTHLLDKLLEKKSVQRMVNSMIKSGKVDGTSVSKQD